MSLSPSLFSIKFIFYLKFFSIFFFNNFLISLNLFSFLFFLFPKTFYFFLIKFVFILNIFLCAYFLSKILPPLSMLRAKLHLYPFLFFNPSYLFFPAISNTFFFFLTLSIIILLSLNCLEREPKPYIYFGSSFLP
jgi:hypothetical protein